MARDRATTQPKRPIKNSLWNVGLLVYTSLLFLVTTPFYIRFLGSEHFGLYMLLLAMIGPFSLVGLGVGRATIKFVAECEGRKDRKTSADFIASTLFFNIMVGLVGAVVIFALARLFATSVFKIGLEDQALFQKTLYWLAVRWFVAQVTATFSGVIQALQRYDVTAKLQGTTQTAIALSGLAALAYGGSLLTLVQIQTVLTLLAGIGWYLVCRSMMGGVRLLPRLHIETLRKTIDFGFYTTMASLGGLMTQCSDRYLLGIFVGPVAIGYYSVCWGVLEKLFSVIYNGSVVLFPAVSRFQGEGDQVAIERIFIAGTLISIVVGSFFFVPLFVLSGDLLNLWLGPEYWTNAGAVLMVLALVGLANSVNIVPSMFLLGIGKTRWVALKAGVYGAMTLGVALILIPRFGLRGAAWGLGTGVFVYLGFVYLTCKYLLHWSDSGRFLTKLVGILGVSFTLAFVLYGVRRLVFGEALIQNLPGLGVLAFGLAILSAIISILIIRQVFKSEMRFSEVWNSVLSRWRWGPFNSTGPAKRDAYGS